LISKDDILSLQHSADGSPWARVVVGSGIDPGTLELSFDGSPWHGVIDSTPPSGEIAKVGGVLLANIGKVGGIAISGIYKIAGKLK
jgi:hypothetical protein